MLLGETSMLCISVLLVLELVLASSASEAFGKCGTTYTSPSDVIWLTTNAEDCKDSVPCEHKIVAPTGHVVKLNFTRLSGLGYSEANSDSSSYYFIEGTSSCQPRIEVTEKYTQGTDTQITRRTTLCYDRIFGSSVVIQTHSKQVILSVYCLDQKYSFFALNFSFIPKPEQCTLECHGRCLQVNQVCDGVADCPVGEDEENCGPIPSAITDTDNSATQTSLILVMVVLLVISIAVVVVCIHRRRKLTVPPQLSHDVEDVTEMWEDNSILTTSSLTQELLQSKNTNYSRFSISKGQYRINSFTG